MNDVAASIKRQTFEMCLTPTTIKMVTGDTFLPVPKSIFIATVKF